MTKTADDHAFLWDGSEPGWVLLRMARSVVEVVLHFGETGPSVKEVAALRKAAPTRFAQKPGSDVLRELRDCREVPLGEWSSEEGRPLMSHFRMSHQRRITVPLFLSW